MQATIFIAGSGGMGRCAALLLTHNSAMNCQIFLGDASDYQLISAKNWLESCQLDVSNIQYTNMNEVYEDVLMKCDVLLDCLPGNFAPQMARLAVKHNLHYANLTEYVKETAEIVELAKNASTGFVLQTGLAPGYVNVLAHKLYQDFMRDNPNSKADRMQMKVGALSKHAQSPSHYAFTWSPIGVATEYVKDAIVVKNYNRILVPALSGRGLITIDGVVYEDNYTSGGAANLPSHFEKLIKDIDYKTLRYPGHYQWVEDTLKNIPISDDRAKKLFDIMLETIAVVEDDVVIMYAAVSGKDKNGFLSNYEKSLRIKPIIIGGLTIRAIQATTASSLCQMAYYLVKNKPKGVILQTDIDVNEFLDGSYVKAVYEN
ncbi:MAG: saccharopine dehydrogenase NADP-binding domain-containing protein [Flavobacteriales bacterium]|nr:saccharopine dehydrogenase NADP-binding domain-containing protein [Flavobacteriales bacterium]